jgi:hypothetical protein
MKNIPFRPVSNEEYPECHFAQEHFTGTQFGVQGGDVRQVMGAQRPGQGFPQVATAGIE